jgi:hypothetical protein
MASKQIRQIASALAVTIINALSFFLHLLATLKLSVVVSDVTAFRPCPMQKNPRHTSGGIIGTLVLAQISAHLPLGREL